MSLELLLRSIVYGLIVYLFIVVVLDFLGLTETMQNRFGIYSKDEQEVIIEAQ